MVRRRRALPEWMEWELLFGDHLEERMEERGVTEVGVRAMLERATACQPSSVHGRFCVHAKHEGRRWVVVVEPAPNAPFLIVVTLFEVES